MTNKQMTGEDWGKRAGVVSENCGERAAGPEPAYASAARLPVFVRSVERSGMSEQSFVDALVQTSLSGMLVWTQVDLERLLLAAERHGLNPVGREVFLVPGGASPLDPAVVVVGVDGWSRILNSHEQFAGMSFRESSQLQDGLPQWAECTMHRWDRRVPTRVREYLTESRGSTAAWVTHPRRMLRHKAMVQCARLAFGLVGIFDADEARDVAEATAQSSPELGAGALVSPSPGPGPRSRFVRSGRAPLGVSAVKLRLDELGAGRA